MLAISASGHQPSSSTKCNVRILVSSSRVFIQSTLYHQNGRLTSGSRCATLSNRHTVCAQRSRSVVQAIFRGRTSSSRHQLDPNPQLSAAICTAADTAAACLHAASGKRSMRASNSTGATTGSDGGSGSGRLSDAVSCCGTPTQEQSKHGDGIWPVHPNARASYSSYCSGRGGSGITKRTKSGDRGYGMLLLGGSNVFAAAVAVVRSIQLAMHALGEAWRADAAVILAEEKMHSMQQSESALGVHRKGGTTPGSKVSIVAGKQQLGAVLWVKARAAIRQLRKAADQAASDFAPAGTYAGAKAVGKDNAAAAVDAAGKHNVAKVVGQLGASLTAASTEALGVSGFLKIARKLGPDGIWGVLQHLGLPGTVKLSVKLGKKIAAVAAARIKRGVLTMLSALAGLLHLLVVQPVSRLTKLFNLPSQQRRLEKQRTKQPSSFAEVPGSTESDPSFQSS